MSSCLKHANDKKNQNGIINFTMLGGIGDIRINQTATTEEIKDTLASLRLDSVISSGFRIGRSLASQYISAGKASIDGLPCEKPDKPVAEGSRVSVRGLGKIRLAQINGKTKKDRISVVIHRYI